MSSRSRFGIFAAIACVLSFANASAARAHSVVVDPSGGGDFTTLQAALNSVAASFAPETVIVRAGAYAETVTLPQRDSQSLLVCSAGPESTRVAGLLLGPSTYGSGSAHRDWTVRGLSVGESVLSTPSKARARFEQCAFAAGLTVNWLGSGVSMPVSECEFLGPTSLLGIYGIAQSLRFRNAPLRTEPRVGGLYYTDCAFAGAPGETLVVAPRTEDLGFTRCTFDSAGVGVWFPNGGFTGLSMNRCRFRRLGLALGEPEKPWVQVSIPNRALQVTQSRFDYCDRALDWRGGGEYLSFNRDTLEFCGDGAVLASAGQAGFFTLLVEDNLGSAIDLVVLAPSLVGANSYVDVSLSTFRRVRGTAVRVRSHKPAPDGVMTFGSNWFDHSMRGAELECSLLLADHNRFVGNTGGGLSLTPVGLNALLEIRSNSFVANGGDGLMLLPNPAGALPTVYAHHNLAAHNSGAGLRLVGAAPSDFSRNDSWSNAGGDFVGVTPDTSNFSLDPRFCDIASGDLTLSSDSPCASSDPFDFIGAEGVGCTLAPTSVAPGEGTAVFSARPNPSRGAVEFALPPSSSGGRLDILDVQGRVVWSRTVGAQAHALSWSGETARGTASPGLYWARLTGTGTVQTRTLIRLR